jgi:protein SCO1/2
MKINKFVLLAISISLVIASLAIFETSRPKELNGAVINPPVAVSDFSLESADGPVSLHDFCGKLVVLYFGYTSCPDVCPLTLSYLSKAVNSLGNQANDVQVIFVSVDWKRDTPEKLATYVSAFHPGFIGLTGNQSQIDQATKEFGIFYQLNPPDANGFYSVDHTATVLVIDRQGKWFLDWPYGTGPDKITTDLQTLVKE